MKIGVRAHDYGKMEIEQLAKRLHAEGYECAQVALPKAFVGIERFDTVTLKHLERIRRSFEDNKIEIPVFSCYMDIGNPEEEIRTHAVDTIKKCLGYCKEAGAKMVGTETACTRLSAGEKQRWHPYMIDSVQRIVEEAQRLDVKFAMEPVYCHPLENLEVVQKLVEQIDDEEHLRLIFDPANVLQMEQLKQQEIYWKTWLSSIGRYVEVIHMKDYDYDSNGVCSPTSLGEGTINYNYIFPWLHQNKPDVYLIREEMKIENAKKDIAYMRRMKGDQL